MHRCAAALLAVVGLACGPPPRRPPVYRVEQWFAIDPSPTETHAHPDAARVLSTATTVAFLPPDGCHSDVEIDVDGPPQAATAALVCESSIARLESAALAAGYQVVSWRALIGDQPPVDRAAAAGVDLLFVIDELAAGADAHQVYTSATTQVRIEPDGDPVVLRDPTGTAARCAAELAPVLHPELAVILDVEMVSVADGRVLWTYRRTHNPAGGARAVMARSRYTATVGDLPEGRSTWRGVIGALAISFGGMGLIATGVIDATGEFDAPRPLYAATVSMLALGIYSLATIDAKTHWRYSPADDVVCLPAHLSLAADLPDRAPGSATVAGCDGRCRDVLSQVDDAVDDLFIELLRLRDRP